MVETFSPFTARLRPESSVLFRPIESTIINIIEIGPALDLFDVYATKHPALQKIENRRWLSDAKADCTKDERPKSRSVGDIWILADASD